MPELPEVENVARSVRPRVVGLCVVGVEIRRPDIIEGDCSAEGLLLGRRISGVLRIGKQLALVTEYGAFADSRTSGQASGRTISQTDEPNEPVNQGKDLAKWVRRPELTPVVFAGPTVCVQLGMTGSLRWVSSMDQVRGIEPHVHVVWRLNDGGVLCFKDPRRFGGLTACTRLAELMEKKWRPLGPDALAVTGGQFAVAFQKSVRPIKSALLDQFVVAGIGNIYADEALFAAGVHPLAESGKIDRARLGKLAGHVRRILKKSIDAGGSTIRDYANGQGEAGGFQDRHQVYGRAGLGCKRCGSTLLGLVLSGRSTVYCPSCQRL